MRGERALTQSMEDYLKRTEIFNVAIIELHHFLLSPEDDACCILPFAENVCDERGAKKFTMQRFSNALQENQERNQNGLQSTHEYMEKRRQKIMSGAPDEFSFGRQDLGG